MLALFLRSHKRRFFFLNTLIRSPRWHHFDTVINWSLGFHLLSATFLACIVSCRQKSNNTHPSKQIQSKVQPYIYQHLNLARENHFRSASENFSNNGLPTQKILQSLPPKEVPICPCAVYEVIYSQGKDINPLTSNQLIVRTQMAHLYFPAAFSLDRPSPTGNLWLEVCGYLVTVVLSANIHLLCYRSSRPEWLCRTSVITVLLLLDYSRLTQLKMTALFIYKP
jgi:hypothetical protein